jgi:hypothetical protein
VVDAVALGNFLIAICANGDNRILLWDGISRYEEVKMGYQKLDINYSLTNYEVPGESMLDVLFFAGDDYLKSMHIYELL